jgi:hypothetical protein
VKDGFPGPWIDSLTAFEKSQSIFKDGRPAGTLIGSRPTFTKVPGEKIQDGLSLTLYPWIHSPIALVNLLGTFHTCELPLGPWSHLPTSKAVEHAQYALPLESLTDCFS